MTKDGVAKKKIKVVPLKEPGEPLIVSIPIDQVGLFTTLLFKFVYNIQPVYSIYPLMLWCNHNYIGNLNLFIFL